MAPNKGFSGQCPHSTSEDSSPRFSSTPGHPAGREGLSHLSSGEFPGADTHPLPIRGTQVSGLGKLWHVLTGRPWLSFPPCPGSSWSFSSLDLHMSSEGPNSAFYTTTCRDQFTQSFNFLRHFKNTTEQKTPKILIDQVAKAEDALPGERVIAERSSPFSCSSKNHLFV